MELSVRFPSINFSGASTPSALGGGGFVTRASLFSVSQPLQVSNLPKRKRNRAPSFEIFEDGGCDRRTWTNVETSKNKGRKVANFKKVRTPLGTGHDTSNACHLFPDHGSSTPFVFNVWDPFWEDKENHVPHAPSTPTAPGQHPSQNCGGAQSSLVPISSAMAPCGIFEELEVPEDVATQVVSVSQRVVLYHVLGIKDKKACAQEIKSAFFKAVRRSHPDRVFGDKVKEAEATTKIQRLLAARGVLLDDSQRRKYDADGVLPKNWPIRSFPCVD